MTHALGVDVSKATEQLVHVNLRRETTSSGFNLAAVYKDVAAVKTVNLPSRI